MGVVGLDELMAQLAGESRAASDNLSPVSMEEGGESSSVLGTYKHRFNPRATFAFLHLLPIFFPFFTSKPTKRSKTQNPKIWFVKENQKTKKKKEAKNHKTQISTSLNLAAFFLE